MGKGHGWLGGKGSRIDSLPSIVHMAHGGRDGGCSLNSPHGPLHFPDPLGFSHFPPFATSPLMGLLSEQLSRS